MNATKHSLQSGIVFQTDLVDIVLADALAAYSETGSVTSAMTDALAKHVARREVSARIDARQDLAKQVSASSLARDGETSITQVGETREGYAVCQDGVSHGTTTTDEKAGYIGAAAETGAMAVRDETLRVATGGNDRIGSDYAIRDTDYLGIGLAAEERIKGEREELESYTAFYARLAEEYELGQDGGHDAVYESGREKALAVDERRVQTTSDAIHAMDWDAIRTTSPAWVDGHQGWVRHSDDQTTVTVPATPQDSDLVREVDLEFGSQRVRERDAVEVGAGATVRVATELERARVPVFEDLRQDVLEERRALVQEDREALDLAKRITAKWSETQGVPEGFYAPVRDTAAHIAEVLEETSLGEIEAAKEGARRAFDEYWDAQPLNWFRPGWTGATVIARVSELSSTINGSYFQRAWLEPLCPGRNFGYTRWGEYQQPEERVRFSSFWSYEAWGETKETPTRTIGAGNKKPWQDSSDAAGNGDVYGLATEIRGGDIVLIENAKPSAYATKGMLFKSLAAHSDTQITVLHRTAPKNDPAAWKEVHGERQITGAPRCGLMSGNYEAIERPERPGSLVAAQVGAVTALGRDAYLSATLEAGGDAGAVERAITAANQAFWAHQDAKTEWHTARQGVPVQLLHPRGRSDVSIEVYEGRDATKDGVPIREFLAQEANTEVAGRSEMAEEARRVAAWSAADIERLEAAVEAPSQDE